MAALTMIWYGCRAGARIRQWGEKMNEVDEIFKAAATPEEMAAYAAPAQNGSPAPQVARQSRVAVGVPR
jgi:hypothetical protein